MAHQVETSPMLQGSCESGRGIKPTSLCPLAGTVGHSTESMEPTCCELKGVLGSVGCLAACQTFTTKHQWHYQKCLWNGPIALATKPFLAETMPEASTLTEQHQKLDRKKKFIIGNINSTKNKSRFESSKNSMMTKHPTSKDTMEMHPPRGRRIRVQGYPPLLRELKISRGCRRP